MPIFNKSIRELYNTGTCKKTSFNVKPVHKLRKKIVLPRKPLMNFEFKSLPDLLEFLYFYATFSLI